MKIILKADDFRLDRFGDKKYSYKEYLKIIKDYNICCSLGVIGSACEHFRESDRLYLKELLINKNVRFFNHSYYHFLAEHSSEFSGTPFEYQRDSVYKNQFLIKRLFDYEIQTFGSVANRIDNNTIRVINQCTAFKYVYIYRYQYIDDIKKQIVYLNGYGILEHKEENGCINFKRFEELFNEVNEELITFQMHPGSWNENDLKEFEKIIIYLKSEKHTFITPEQL